MWHYSAANLCSAKASTGKLVSQSDTEPRISHLITTNVQFGVKISQLNGFFSAHSSFILLIVFLFVCLFLSLKSVLDKLQVLHNLVEHVRRKSNKREALPVFCWKGV